MKTSRKLISAVLACLMLLSMFPMAASAEDMDPETCTHAYELKSTLKQPTCTAAGIGKYVCTLCAHSKYDSVPAAHTKPETGVTTTPATCGKDGSESYTCVKCGETVTSAIPATGEHTWEDGYIDATCTENAKAGEMCSVCGAPKGNMEEVPGTATGHSLVLDTTNPSYKAVTCTEDGLNTMKCSKCDYTKDEEVRANGHDWKDSEDPNDLVEADCENAAGIKQYCTKCDATQVNPFEGELAVPAKGHKGVEIPAVPATCTAGGKSAGKKCSVCNKVLEAPTDTPALSHEYAADDEGQKKDVEAATCIAGESYKLYKTCTRCEEEILVETVVGDASGADQNAHKKVTKGNPLKPATCTTSGIAKYECELCHKDLGYQTLEAQHTYGKPVVTDATCTEAGSKVYTCSKCVEGTEGHTKEEMISATGHKWGETGTGTVVKAATCGTAGQETLSCLNGCGETKTGELPATDEHSYIETTTPATCTEKEKAGWFCEDCGKAKPGEEVVEFGEALGHDMQVDTTNANYQAATCTTGGTDTLKCSRCDHTETQTTTALGHAWNDGVYQAANCEHAEGVLKSCTRNGCDDTEFEPFPDDLGEAKKDHTLVDIPAKKPTCTETGTTGGKKCSVCGTVTLEPTEVEAKNHDFTNVEATEEVETPATCQAPGSKKVYKVCNTCGEKVQQGEAQEIAIDENAHDKVMVGSALKTANCATKTNGIAKYKCSICNKDLSYQTTPYTEAHQYGVNPAITDATCTADGSKVWSCTLCTADVEGHTKSETISALGHNYSDTPDASKSEAPTCGAAGKNVYVCANNCGVDKEVEVEATGEHTFEDEVIPATCTEPEKIGEVCSVCGAEGTTTTVEGSSPLGHALEIDTSDPDYQAPTCTEDGSGTKKCTREGCDFTETTATTIEKLGHDWGDDELVEASCQSAAGVKQTCQREGCGETQVIEFTGDLADPKKQHTPVNVEEVPATCSATGTSAGKKCSVCGEVLEGCEETEKLSHTSGAAVRENEVAPSVGEDGNTVNGSYDEVIYCTVCNAEISRETTEIVHDDDNHTYTKLLTELKKASCTENGIGKYQCSACTATTYKTVEAGHVWGEGTITKQATCGEAGVKTFTCERTGGCTDSTAGTKTEEVPATGEHDLEDVTTEADCINPAKAGKQCKNCDYSEEMKPVAGSTALGHNWVDDTDSSENQAATCTESGKKAQKCTRTGCTETQVLDTDALGHEPGEAEYVPATCTEGAKSVVKCTRCNAAVSEDDLSTLEPATNHAGTTEEKAEVPATCTTAGTAAGTFCTACNQFVNGGAEIPIAEDAHDWNEGEVTTEPTCTEAGIKTFTCQNNSEHTKTEEVPAAHKWGEPEVTKEATCTEDGVQSVTCSVCGAKDTSQKIDALGHDFETNEPEVVESTCTVAGTSTMKCSRCDETDVTKLPLAEHDFEETYQEATCTENAKAGEICKVCKQGKEGVDLFEVPNSALGHNYVVDTEQSTEATCTEDGTKVSVCSRCGDKQSETVTAKGHTPGTPTMQEPTCTESGKSITKCTVCGEVIQTEDLGELSPATGHQNTTHKDAVPATCNSVGHTAGTWCNDCQTFTEGGTEIPIDANSHVAQITKVLKPATCSETGIGKAVCKFCGADMKYVPIETIPHTWGAPVTGADGTTTKTCSVCGAVETVTGQECQHTNKEVIPAVPPTCKDTGLTEGLRCANCSETLTAPTIVPKTEDHTWGAEYTEEILDEDGLEVIGYVTKHTCSVCGKIEKVTTRSRVPVLQPSPAEELPEETFPVEELPQEDPAIEETPTLETPSTNESVPEIPQEEESPSELSPEEQEAA